MKKIIFYFLILMLLFQLGSCGSTDTNEISSLQDEIERLEQELEELRKYTQEQNTNELPSDNNIDIDCPEIIEYNGYTLSVKDIYTKCCNTDQSIYDFDGYFMYITVEIADMPQRISEDEAFIFLDFDMYDKDGHYTGSVTPISCGPLTNAEIGTIINGDALLEAYNVVQLAYAPY